MESQEVSGLKAEIDKLSESIKDLRKAILGDEFSKNGYKHRLENIEARVNIMEDFIKRWKWVLAGSIGLGGYGGLTFVQQLIEVISKVFKH